MIDRIPVCAMPSLDPAFGAIKIDAPFGWTVEELIHLVLPDVTEDTLSRARVWLVSNAGETLLHVRAQWSRIRPRKGVRLMIKLVPAGDDFLRNALLIAVSIGATALGQFWAGPAIFAATGSAVLAQVGAAAVALAVTIAGGYLVNLLIPPAETAARQSERPLYQISGWNNSANPDGAVPSLMGRMRVAPLFAAPSYTEIVGDEQYVRALFTFGYGPIELSDLRIKDTPLSSFNEVEYEIREGYADDDPVTLYPQQVIEEALGVELRRDRLRDDAGNIIGEGPETPVSRYSAGDATEANIILSFPTGLGGSDDTTRTVSIRIEQRLASGGSWADVETLNITSKRLEGFYRSFRWAFPSRGRWEIRCTRITHEATDATTADRTVFLALQSFRPEYPLNFDKPLCLVALRIRATYQLNSQIDSFNALAERLVPDWDYAAEEWVVRKTRNPASYLRLVLQGPECAFPESDGALDLEQFQDFHDFCRTKDLKFDKVRESEASQWAVLTEVAAAGRASPRFDGSKWGVVIDRPQELTVAHVNSRNSREFSWSRNYFQPPDAFRVSFLDETSDYQQRERVVPWPGYLGDINVTEQLPMSGKTDPDEVWREARRRQYEIIHRPDQFTCIQDGAVRTATRGDLVKGNYDTLVRTMAACRVSFVRENVITLDGLVTMEAGESYAIRFMRYDEAGVGSSVLRNVVLHVGETDTIAVTGSGYLPERDTLIQFGISGSESIDLIVAGTQAGEKMTTVLTMLAAAPIIDTLTDAEIAPAWNGRAGGDAAARAFIPGVPVATSTEIYYDETETEDGVIVSMAPALGTTVPVGFFVLRNRLAAGDGGDWLETTIAAADAFAIADGYGVGADIVLQRRAVSYEDISSPWSAQFSIDGAVVITDTSPTDIASGSVIGGANQANVLFTTGATGAFSPIETVDIFFGLEADGIDVALLGSIEAAPSTAYDETFPCPEGTFYFFASPVSHQGVAGDRFSLGQATIT